MLVIGETVVTTLSFLALSATGAFVVTASEVGATAAVALVGAGAFVATSAGAAVGAELAGALDEAPQADMSITRTTTGSIVRAVESR